MEKDGVVDSSHIPSIVKCGNSLAIFVDLW